MTTPVRATTVASDFFENRIRPLFVERCQECHSVSTEKPGGGLLLDSKVGLEKGGASGPPVVPGKPEQSLLIKVLRGTAHDNKPMPPKGGPLKEAEIVAFEDWIRAGAVDPRTGPSKVAATGEAKKHWAFQKPVRPAFPRVVSREWIQTGLDAFILARLESNGLKPSPEANRRTLLRRITFDLTGLPPTPTEMQAFLRDTSKEAYAQAVDRLLASSSYGERWGRHWLDVARYADSKGYVFEEERRYAHSHTYRDWVVNAFNRDLPFDRFVIEQIAGDQVATGEDKSSLAALGFLTLGRRFLNNSQDIIDDRIDVVTRGLMGLTVQCARCHDHKFDPIPTADYYSLYGIFASSKEPDEKPLLGPNLDLAAVAEYGKEKELQEKEKRDYRAEQTSATLGKLRAKVSDYLLVVHDSEGMDGPKREGLARERSLDPNLVTAWKTRLIEWRGATNPVFVPWFAFERLPVAEFATGSTGLVTSLINGRLDGKIVNGQLPRLFQAQIPTNFTVVAHRYGELFAATERLWRLALETAQKAGLPEPTSLPNPDDESLRQILYGVDSPIQGIGGGIDRFFATPVAQKTRALQRKLDELDATHPGAPLRAMVLVDNQTPSDPVIFKRGNPGNPGSKVPRQQLALVSGTNRVPFQRGSGRLEWAESIVSTNNPLTARVWVNRMWQHHFGNPLVRTPSDFGVRSDPPVNPELLDYLAVRLMESGWSVKALHRELLLSATYRQSSDPLASGGTTNWVAKAEVQDSANTLYWRMNRKRTDFESMRDSLLAVSGSLDRSLGGRAVEMYDTEKPTVRRTLYGFIDRQNLPGILRSFDFASPDATSPGRFQTSVPQQALFWLNSRSVANEAQALLERPEIAKVSLEARVRRLYQLTYQRDPSAEEQGAARKFLKESLGDTLVPPSGAAWTYGVGWIDPVKGRSVQFQPFTVFKKNRWQMSATYPTKDSYAFASLEKSGGHPGKEPRSSVIRRWTAPRNLHLKISGPVRHSSTDGDGVRASLVSSRQGILGEWKIANKSEDIFLKDIEVRAGETLDFVVDPLEGDTSDAFDWAPDLMELNAGKQTWSAAIDFSGQKEWPRALDAWQRYAQVLLASNEFNFVD